jgi:hypothetical protein
VIKRLLVSVFVGVGGVYVVATQIKSDYKFERSIDISAPVAKIQPVLEDFSRWPQFWPWEKLDPKMQRSMSDPPNGIGARYGYESTRGLGKGYIELVEIPSPGVLRFKLEMLAPRPSVASVVFTVTEASSGKSHVSFETKATGRLFETLLARWVESLAAAPYEQSLTDLKTLIEGGVTTQNLPVQPAAMPDALPDTAP